MNKFKAIGIAFVRTSIVPPTAGFLATWMVSHYGVRIQTAWVYTGVSMFASGIYYLAFHLVESLAARPNVQKWAGIALGHPTQPTYLSKTNNMNDAQ